MRSEYVQERFARLLAEHRPRRARADGVADRDLNSGRRATGLTQLNITGPPEFQPSEDDASVGAGGDVGWVGPSSRSASTGSSVTASPAEHLGVVEDSDEREPRRLFGRTHLGVVSVLLVLGLLVAGWSVLRARPVAVATTPTVSGTAAAPAQREGPTPVVSPASPAASAAPRILVHVLGAVRKPRVVNLPDGSRVSDALNAAGGLSRDADPAELNLAQVLADGEQLVIGTRARPSGEVRSGSTSGSTGSKASGTGSGSPSGAGVNLNRATATQLDALPGVGPVTAEKILAWRTEHQRFSRVEELQEIDGIGPKTYAEIAPHVRV